MAGNSYSTESESLLLRIQQLEHERDELRKDIEQLCMQQAGPSYLVVATKMHFQRTAALEQELENLKKKLAGCMRENTNLQEELSEAYRIKSQLADLHSTEVTKNLEAEKQLKFFQGCVASAFAERDNAIMEAEKAKEKEEIMARNLNDIQSRMEVLSTTCLEQERVNEVLKANLRKQEEENEAFQKVIDKFYEIRQQSSEGLENISWDCKCICLLNEPSEFWSYNDMSTAKYISALEEELQCTRNSVDDLQNKLRVGLEIENHVKKRVRELEKKQHVLDKTIRNGLAGLRHLHSLCQTSIMSILEKENSYIRSTIGMLEERVRLSNEARRTNSGPYWNDEKLDNNSPDIDMKVCSGLSLATERDTVFPSALGDRKADATEALAQALQEKVGALLLLSQQEERHLLDRNTNAALQKKIEELQRNLLQVTNEKVKALVELAKLKQDYQLLLQKSGPEMKQGKLLAAHGEKRLGIHVPDGRLRNLLKRTYLSRWVGSAEVSGNATDARLTEGNFFGRKSNNSMDIASLKIENATLKESLDSVDHLTSTIHRLRLSLLQVKETASAGVVSSVSEALDDIISEAKLVKTALGSSLPVSWSAGEDMESLCGSASGEADDYYGDSSHEKVDSVTAAGFEMVDLLILAAQILKELKLSTANLVAG